MTPARNRPLFALLYLLARIPVLGRALVVHYVTVHTRRAASSARGTAASFARDYLRVWRGGSSSPERTTVFMIHEPRFNRIIHELDGRWVDVFVIGRGIFDYLFLHHLHDYLAKNKRGFGEYSLSAYERYPAERRRYLADCTRAARLFRKHFGSGWIVLPKYNDDYTLEVIQGFHDAGWTTVVYDREGTVTKRRLEVIPPIVARQAPVCDSVITYNQTHRAFFERVFDLATVRKPEIVVMGNPASDDWFHDPSLLPSRESRPSGRQILYFAFGEFSYVYDEEYLRGKTEVWRDLLTDIHEGLAAHLRDAPGDTVLYKRGAKGNRDYWQESEKLLALPNARLIPNTASANRLISQSDVVVAFQTTALVDAMHTDKILIYCGWGARYEELKSGLIDFEAYAREGAILHARSDEELRQMLAMDPERIPVDLAARKRIRETFTTNPDGRVAVRFAEWLTGKLRPAGRAA